ncbi:MAG TPA: ABC transporter permease [Cyclobacteriaceae bacterium]|nr:ABC transporter permease [Cyclobacteriaceae bacterium]
MLQNILLVTLRHFVRNINHTVINILGLSVGIASCIVVFMIVRSELSYDKFHSKYNEIYRVVHTNTMASGVEYSAVTPYPFNRAWHQDFSDVPLATSFHHQSEVQVTIGAEKQNVEYILFADSLFFRVFDFKVLEGDPNKDLGQPGKVFLTKSLAEKILKPNSGRTIKLNTTMELEVAGIIQDPPPSSHIRFDLIASMPSLTADFIGFPLDAWGMEMSGYTYVVLPPNITEESIERRFHDFVKKYYSSDDSKEREYFLQPLSDIHFSGIYEKSHANIGGISKSNLYVLVLLGCFLLAIACVNFINISTALAVRKAREIGVRKTLGASRQQLSRQFMTEAFIITIVSMLIALVEVEVFTPIVSMFLSRPLSLSFNDPVFWPYLVLLTCLTALLSGAYPAWILSRFNPAVVLKGNLSAMGSTASAARKYLVVFQFLVAQMLIIGTLVVSDQMQFFRSAPLGFTHSAVVNVELPENNHSKREAFYTRLQSIAGVESVSMSFGSPTSDNNFTTSYFLTGQSTQDRYETQLKPVDVNYFKTYGLEMAAGRWFNETEDLVSKDTAIDVDKKPYVYVVNEALANSLGFSAEEMLGKKITTGLNAINAEVVGVVKDFHTASLHENVKPTVMVMFPHFTYDAGIRFSGNVSDLVRNIETAYNAVYPDYVMNYKFLDDHLESLYAEEQRSYTLIRIFTALAIFISCLGLLGLVSFLTHQKVKEVGVRKVFGASVASIVILFSKGFVKLIAIAFLVAAPAAWYFMNQWLEGFAYKTTVGWHVFAIAIGLTTFVAMATVLYQSVRAALANPATSLRSE